VKSTQNGPIYPDRLALDVAGQPYYPVGIPLQERSRGKIYTVKIVILNGHIDDYLVLRASRHNLVTVHQYPLADLKTPMGALRHISNRLIFGLSHTNALFILLSFALIMIVIQMHRSKQISHPQEGIIKS